MAGGQRAGRLGARAGHRPPLHPLHLRHHGQAQGRAAGQRRPCRRPALEHAGHLRGGCRGCLLGRLRPGLGGGPLLHPVWPSAARLRHGAVRGQAGAHPGRGGLLAGDRGAPGQGLLHRPHGLPRHPQGRPGLPPEGRPRPVLPALSVRGRGAAGPAHLPLAAQASGHPGHRPLVADGNRLADLRQPDGPGAPGRPARFLGPAGSGLRPAHPGRGWPGTAAGRGRSSGAQGTLAAGRLPQPLAGSRALPRSLLVQVSRPLPHWRQRLSGRGWLGLHHGPRRRCHQCGRPSPLHRRLGGGGGRASGGGGMRRGGDGRCRPGAGASGPGGAEGWCESAGRGAASGIGAAGAPRPGRLRQLQAGAASEAAAQDALRQDSAPSVAQGRRWRTLRHPLHHRRPGDHGGNPGGPGS